MLAPTEQLMRLWQVPIAIGWLCYLASFFLPAFDLPHSSDPFIGWDAMCEALGAGMAFHVSSALTNLAMICTLHIFWARAQGLSKGLLSLMVVATVLNLWWYVGYPEDRHGFMISYYLWWASFAMVTTGLVLRRLRSQAEVNSTLAG